MNRWRDVTATCTALCVKGFVPDVHQNAVNDRPIKRNLMVKTKRADYPESFLHKCTPTFVRLLRYPCLDPAAGSGRGEWG